MGVHVKKLRGPVFADYELLHDVPNGAILVGWDKADAVRLRFSVKSGVMVVARVQEQDDRRCAATDPHTPPLTSSVLTLSQKRGCSRQTAPDCFGGVYL